MESDPLPHPQGIVGERPITAAATDRYVASDSQAVERFTSEYAFRFMAEAARDQGYITQEALEHVMTALYGGDR